MEPADDPCAVPSSRRIRGSRPAGWVRTHACCRTRTAGVRVREAGVHHPRSAPWSAPRRYPVRRQGCRAAGRRPCPPEHHTRGHTRPGWPVGKNSPSWVRCVTVLDQDHSWGRVDPGAMSSRSSGILPCVSRIPHFLVLASFFPGLWGFLLGVLRVTQPPYQLQSFCRYLPNFSATTTTTRRWRRRRRRA